MKRRDVVRALLTPQAPDAGDGPPAHAAEQPAPLPPGEGRARISSGAVRAMGLEIGRLTDDARAAETLRQQLHAGAVVIDIATSLVDPSFVSDRLSRTADGDFRGLVESMRDVGQQVPILVRPHPAQDGRYQIAYGHRRAAAAAELGVPVRAIVRPLSDAELVLAQGKENGERRNLSYIERALFAAELQARGFDRATLNGALGVHTAEMTRLLGAVAAVPAALIRRIGPAPRAGRQRWAELGRELARPGVADQVDALLDQPSMQALSSDRRFEALIAALRGGAAAAEAENFVDARGIVVGHVERGAGVVKLVLDERAAPGLGAMVIREMGMIVARYSSGHR